LIFIAELTHLALQGLKQERFIVYNQNSFFHPLFPVMALTAAAPDSAVNLSPGPVFFRSKTKNILSEPTLPTLKNYSFFHLPAENS
jgi:hypothetical protein